MVRPLHDADPTFQDVGAVVYRDHAGGGTTFDDDVGAAAVGTVAAEYSRRRRRRRAKDEDDDETSSENEDENDHDENDDDDDDDDDDDHRRPPPSSSYNSSFTTLSLFASRPHLAVLPVILLEFLSLALTRAVLPSLLLRRYGSRTYVVMGFAECVRGGLAFLACPAFGRLSDVWGRRPCLLVTVAGTLAPVCSLAFWGAGYDDDDDDCDYGYGGRDRAREGVASTASGMAMEDGEAGGGGGWYPPPDVDASAGFFDHHRSSHLFPSIHRIDAFVVLLALSGVCSSTFTLTFAYISDVVKDRDGRVAAYGLALATFGLSFTIGPLLGGYLANVDDHGRGHGGRDRMSTSTMGGSFEDDDDNSEIHPLGQHRVFLTSLILALLDLFYIHFLLPESLNSGGVGGGGATPGLVDVSVDGHFPEDDEEEDDGDDGGLPSAAVADASGTSNAPLPGAMGMGGGAASRRASARGRWNPLDSVRYLATDPVLSTVGRVTFLYYTALHAVVSTLVLYATRRFHLGPQRLGELMAALGLSTMLSEAVLVRIAIPLLGETRCMRIGLASFALQCVLLAVADKPWHLFGCAFLAMAGNLVYPSVSSLVSSTVRPDMVGRALGAVNGVKSLTEGIGPLIFGTVRRVAMLCVYLANTASL